MADSIAQHRSSPMLGLESSSFETRFNGLKNRLSDCERRAGEYFLGNPDAIYKSITEVVRNSSISHGTVIRFCQKMGCKGFQDFKILLAKGHIHTPKIEVRKTTTDVASGYLTRIVNQLRATSRLLDRKALLQSAKAITSADKVLVVGMAGSASLAMYFDYHLSRIGIQSSFLNEGFNIAIRASYLRTRDVYFAISFSGSTKDVVDGAVIAKRRGATVIAVTNFFSSPLVDVADLALFTAMDRDPLACEIRPNSVTEFVLDLLFECLCHIKPSARQNIDRTAHAVAKKRV